MRATLFGLFIGCLLALLPPLRADQMIPLPIEELSARAQLILQGKVISTTVQRDPEGRIYTKIDLQVDEVWKGSLATNHFTLVHGGGILGDEGVRVSGQVEYEVGEETVVFLVLNRQSEGITLGLSQGKFHIWKDPVSGEKLAHNRFHGLNSFAANPPAYAPNRIPAPIHHRLTLANLKQLAVGGGK